MRSVKHIHASPVLMATEVSLTLILNLQQETLLKYMHIHIYTSPISCSCWISSFMCSSPANGFTLHRTKSTKVKQGTTGKAAKFLRTPGNQFTTPSKKPVHFGTPCDEKKQTDNAFY